jgi:Lrp/AsnC family leucine-responsive transcriptional regulator
LISAGFIEGFRAVLNPEKMELDHIAFVEVKLADTSERTLLAFNEAVKKVKEVEECHMIAGRFHYLLKVQDPRYREIPARVGRQDIYDASRSQYVHQAYYGNY